MEIGRLETSVSISGNNTPCLVCGEGGEFSDPVVKEEVIPDNHPFDEDGNGGHSSLSMKSMDEAPTGPVNMGSTRRSTQVSPLVPKMWTDQEKIAYQLFIMWFHLKSQLMSKAKRTKNYNLGWNGDSGKDPFPFCGPCKNLLFKLMESERKREELEKEINSGIENLRSKMNSCEDLFGRMEIYEKDQRYKRVRRYIVKDFNCRYPPRSSNQTGVANKRKSSRRQSQSTHLFTDDLALGAELLPYTVSTTDKTTDEGSLNIDKKPDVTHLLEEKDSHGQVQEEMENERNESTGGRSKRKRKPRFPITVLCMESEESAGEPSPCEDGNMHSCADDDDNNMDDNYEVYSPQASSLPSSLKEHKNGEEKKKKKTKVSYKESTDSEPDLDSAPHASRRKRKKRGLVEEDVDWTLKDDLVDELENEGDSTSDEDFVFNDLEDGWGKAKIVVDPEKKTVTFRNLVFLQKDNKLECMDCGNETIHKRERIKHHYLVHHTNVYACKRCDFRGNCRTKIRDHIATVHEGAPPKLPNKSRTPCPICGKPVAHVKYHMWSHKSQEERDEALANDKNLPKFVLKTHQCDQCGMSFPSTNALRRHQETRHVTEEIRESKRELCPECGGTFLDLRRHRKNIHKIGLLREYPCLEPQCGKVFKGLHRLARHKDAVHRKLRPFQCTICPRSFSDQKKLQYHVDVHNGVRPWQCSQCPSAFGQKRHLKNHESIFHTEGRQPKRKSYVRGTTMLSCDMKKKDLIREGKYLPPSALATWAAGREPTSHFPLGTAGTGATSSTSASSSQDSVSMTHIL